MAPKRKRETTKDQNGPKRTKIKKIRKLLQYSPKALNAALAEIAAGRMGISAAGRHFNIPKSTIIDRMKGRSTDTKTKPGPTPLLGANVEEKIKTWVLNIAKCGFPLKREDLFDTAAKVTKQLGKEALFKEGKPGEKWYRNFMKRHPEIALREAEGVNKARAIISEQYIRSWFTDLQQYLEENNLREVLLNPDRIFNADESGFSLCPKTGKVLAPKGYKNLYNVKLGNEKDLITVLILFSASGKIGPPLVVFPYVRPPRALVESMPRNWVLGKSESGWMKGEVFFEYIVNEFNAWLEENHIERPIILFLDGHKSHLTLPLSEVCEKLGIVLYALPPNTTHILQPADVSVFRPMKVEWKKTVKKWQERPENANQIGISKLNFCRVFEETLNANDMTNTIINGFRKCGLYPLNPDSVDYTKCVQNILEEVNQKKDEAVISKNDLEIAEKVIGKIKDKLTSQGIDANIIINEIRNLLNLNNNLEVGEIISLTDAQIVPCDIVLDEVLDDQQPDVDLNTSFLSLKESVGDYVSLAEIEPTFNTEEDYSTNETNKIVNLLPENGICDRKTYFKDENTETQKKIDQESDEKKHFLEEKIEKPNEERNIEENSLKVKYTDTKHSSENKNFDDNIDVDHKQSQEIASKITNENYDDKQKKFSENENKGIKIISNIILREKVFNISDEEHHKGKEKNLENTNSLSRALNEEKPGSFSSISSSSSFEKHLMYPEPLKKSTKNQKERMPSAISSNKWRDYYNNKANVQRIKTQEAEKRKQERAIAKENKEMEKNQRKKRKKTKKTNTRKTGQPAQPLLTKTGNNENLKCAVCQEELISDAEDEDERNIGCDNCPEWFHMKCTEFCGLSYEVASTKDYICFKCT